MDDVRAVMEPSARARAALVGVSEGGADGAPVRRHLPERTAAIVVYGARVLRALPHDYPWAPPREEWREVVERRRDDFGSPAWPHPRRLSPHRRRRGDAALVAPLGAQQLQPGRPSGPARMNMRHRRAPRAPSISAPTLVLHPTDDEVIELGRPLHRRPHAGAGSSSCPGSDHGGGCGPRTSAETERFLREPGTAASGTGRAERILATVLFTDIVDSTAGCASRRPALARAAHRHHAPCGASSRATAGTSSTPRATASSHASTGRPAPIRCACAIVDSVGDIGLEVRAGLHTGECEQVDGKVGGIAVHIGARVAAQAGAGEVIVSRTVKDLVAGSGIEFERARRDAAQGVPGDWELFATARAAASV